MLVGKLKEIWRFPVKSLGGECLTASEIHKIGMAGDRAWALIDGETGDICSAKSKPKLLNLQARYMTEPGSEVAYGSGVSGVAIQFPDGRSIEDPREASLAISEYIGKPVELRPLEPPENLDHYRLSTPLGEAEFARMFNIQAGEDGPDFSDYADSIVAKLSEYACFPGTYYDVFPLHLLTTASLDHMQALSEADFDFRRFRPNLLVETLPEIQGLAEFDWVGKGLRIGNTVLRVESRTIRCSMPSREQVHYGITQSPAISKTVYQTTNRYFGANIAIIDSGGLHAGDDIELIDID
jgi:uncharacterized protein YcbX